ncbi:MAG: hypothetical protein NZX77_03100, partial [Polyangiaceae bacterium]|nr:hypothetical protein [Polyangiaceae bacterium]
MSRRGEASPVHEHENENRNKNGDKDWTVGSEQDFSLREDDLRVGVRPNVYVLPCPVKDPSVDRWHAY